MKIFILIKTIDKDVEIVSTSLNKKLLSNLLKKEVKNHIEEYYDTEDPNEKTIANRLLDAVEKDSTSWSDGDEECPMSYHIEESEVLDYNRTEEKVDAKVAVAEQVVAMIENNIVRGYGIEHFTGWCEDGDVFYNGGYDDMPDDTKQDAIFLMKEVAPHVDKVSELLNPHEIN